MMFEREQRDQLNAKLDPRHVRERQQAGQKLSYLEGWLVIAEANRIFGHGMWHRELRECRCVFEGKTTTRNGERDACSYVATVRVTVLGPDGATAIRDGTGAGHGIGSHPGEAHESAIKEAETDAMKRALMTFGNPFGLALYDKERTQVEDPRVAAAKDRPDLQPDRIGRFERDVNGTVAAESDLPGLDKLWRRISDRVKEIALVDPAAQMRIVSYFSQRKAELQRGNGPTAPAEPAERRQPSGGTPPPPRGGSPASGQRSPSNRPFALRDEQDKPCGAFSTIDAWLVAANGIACEFRDATEIADFLRHNTAELKRMDAVASGDEQRALAEFRGVLDHALKSALGDDPPGRPKAPKKTTQPLTAEEAREANAKLAAFQDKTPPDDGLPF